MLAFVFQIREIFIARCTAICPNGACGTVADYWNTIDGTGNQHREPSPFCTFCIGDLGAYSNRIFYSRKRLFKRRRSPCLLVHCYTYYSSVPITHTHHLICPLQHIFTTLSVFLTQTRHLICPDIDKLPLVGDETDCPGGGPCGYYTFSISKHFGPTDHCNPINLEETTVYMSYINPKLTVDDFDNPWSYEIDTEWTTLSQNQSQIVVINHF